MFHQLGKIPEHFLPELLHCVILILESFLKSWCRGINLGVPSLLQVTIGALVAASVIEIAGPSTIFSSFSIRLVYSFSMIFVILRNIPGYSSLLLFYRPVIELLLSLTSFLLIFRFQGLVLNILAELVPESLQQPDLLIIILLACNAFSIGSVQGGEEQDQQVHHGFLHAVTARVIDLDEHIDRRAVPYHLRDITPAHPEGMKDTLATVYVLLHTFQNHGESLVGGFYILRQHFFLIGVGKVKDGVRVFLTQLQFLLPLDGGGEIALFITCLGSYVT